MNKDLELAFDAYAAGERDLAHQLFDALAESYLEGKTLDMGTSTSGILYRPAHVLAPVAHASTQPAVVPTPVRVPQVQAPEFQDGEERRLTAVTYGGPDAGTAPVGSLPPAQASAADDWEFESQSEFVPSTRTGMGTGRPSLSSDSEEDDDGDEPAEGSQVPVAKVEKAEDKAISESKPEPKDDDGSALVLKVTELSDRNKEVQNTGRIPVSRSSDPDEDVGDEAEEESEADGDELDELYASEEQPETQDSEDSSLVDDAGTLIDDDEDEGN